MRWNILVFVSLSVFTGVCHGAATISSLIKSAVLDDAGNYELYWKFDDTTITFEVQVNTLGWIGFGISPNGDMTGSDIVIGWVDSAGTGHLEDRYATGRFLPAIDDHQDWILMKSSQTDTKTIMQFKRNLKPCDDKDVDISEATARLIWAYHSDDPTSETDLLKHTTRGAKSVMLLTMPLDPPIIPSDSFEWRITMPNETLPVDETVYLCRAFNIPTKVNAGKHHAIKIEAIVHPGNVKYVHHMILYGCASPVAAADLVNSAECFNSGFAPRDACSADIYGWAVGGGVSVSCKYRKPFLLPENVGFPFGEADSPQAVILEIHYTNPDRDVIIDSSGVVVTLTPTLRKYDAGIMEAGMLVTERMIIPPGSPSFVYHGHCPSNCLSEAMDASNKTEINVFAGLLHTHLAGRKIKFRHFRDGVELPPIFQDDHYNSDYQEYRLRKDVVVQKGDALLTECTYGTLDRTNTVWGGIATTDEMCMTFMVYYPKITLTNCMTAPLPNVYMAALGLTYNRTTLRQDVNGVTWTDALKSSLQSIVIDPTQPMFTRCQQQGTFASSEHLSVIIPDAITEEYTAPFVECKNEVDVYTSVSPEATTNEFTQPVECNNEVEGCGTDGSEKATPVMFFLYMFALVAAHL